MSETLKTLETRRSCRAYRPDPVEDEKLEAILKAGTYAASGMGRQSAIIIAVTNKEMRDRLSGLNAAVMGKKPEELDPFYGAPAVLVVLSDRSMPTHVYDGALVMGNLMNAAQDLGIASCWVHRAKEVFDSEEGKAILKEIGIEGDYEGIGNLIIGYAAEPSKEAPARKENYVYYVR